MRLENDRAYGALDATNLHDPILQDVPELLDIISPYKRNDVELTSHFVQLLDIVELGQGLDYVVHVRRLDEDVNERQSRSHWSTIRLEQGRAVVGRFIDFLTLHRYSQDRGNKTRLHSIIQINPAGRTSVRRS